MRYAFGDFELDDSLFELRKKGALVHLRAQALDFLIHLVRNGARVVTKQELLEAIWDGAAVSETALAQAALAVRRALEDDGEAPEIVQTIRGRGYRFVVPVSAVEDAPPVSVAVFAAPPPPSSGRGALIGREAPLAKLEELFDLASRGEGGVAVVLGEAGAGKTRVLEELSSVAASSGARVLSSSCYDDDGAPAFWPWARLVRQLASDEAGKRAVAAVSADLAPLLADQPPGVRAAEEDADGRFRAFDALISAFRAAAKERSLLLIVDDVQWADAASLLFLKFAAKGLRASRALVVASCRSSAIVADPAVQRAVGSLARADPRRSIELLLLTREHLAELAEAALGRPPSETLVTRLLEKTAGNPLLATQTLHALRAGVFAEAPGGTSAMLEGEAMRGAIGTLLDELSPACLTTLAGAAVLGREFSVATLMAMEGPRAGEVPALLEEARKTRILVAAHAAETFRFFHALVRDVVYKRLPLSERSRLHGAAAEILAKAHGPGALDHASRIAHHYVQAVAHAGRAKAIVWSLRAARAAAAAGANDEAKQHVTTAAQLLAHATRRDLPAAKAVDPELKRLASLGGELAAAAADVAATLATRRASA